MLNKFAPAMNSSTKEMQNNVTKGCMFGNINFEVFQSQ